MTRERTPITAQRRCYCGHGEWEHNDKGECLGKTKGGYSSCIYCKDGFSMSGYDPQTASEEVEQAGTTYERTTFRHPAFAQIGAGRVSGGAYLYGSDFQHRRYITLTIWESEQSRHLSDDRHSAGTKLIEVAMSEAQWATFISSLNQGGGVPCTLEWDQTGPLPRIRLPYDRKTQFSEEMVQHLDTAKTALLEAYLLIDALPVSEVKRKALRDKLHTAEMNIGPNMNFVTDRFDEHMERTVERAKMEVNAYVGHLESSLAMKALAAAGEKFESPILLLEEPQE